MRSVEIIGSYKNIQTVQKRNKYVGLKVFRHILVHPAWPPRQKKRAHFELTLKSEQFSCFLKIFFAKSSWRKFCACPNNGKMQMKRRTTDLSGSLSVAASISIKIIVHVHASVCLFASVSPCLRVSVSLSLCHRLSARGGFLNHNNQTVTKL